MPAATEFAIKAEGLHKAFGSTRALDGLDLFVRAGEVMGFLGPNGSGKSTAIRVLMGLLRHDSGRVALLGRDPWTDAVSLHRHVSYVPGDVNLWPSMSGGEIIDLLGKLGTGLDPSKRAEMIDRFDFDPTKKGRTYSKGNRQKVALITALAGNASVFIFDEPTSGLDPLMEATFQDAVRDLVADGKTVLLSSHVLAEVEALCDQVTIIREGRTVESGSLAEMRHLTHTAIEVSTSRPLDAIVRLDGVDSFVGQAGSATFTVVSSALPVVMAELATLGIESIVAHPPTLEELFMRHYKAATAGPDVADAAVNRA